MSALLHMTTIWLAVSSWLVLACDRPQRRNQTEAPKDEQHAQADKPAAQPNGTIRTVEVTPLRIGGEVSAPKPASPLNIRWPYDPAQCYEFGVAVFESVVGSNGSVRHVTLLKGSNNEFTRAAREAIAQQRFEPAMYRGKPVDVIYHVSVNHVPLRKVKGPC